MWKFLAAVGIVGSLVALTMTERFDEPVLKPALQRMRLSRILVASKRRRLTLTEAEDGLVLSRQLGEDDLARWFTDEVRKLKRAR